MTYRSGLLTGAVGSLLAVGLGAGVWFYWPERVSSSGPSASAPPAVIPQTIKEDQLNTITLSPVAAARLQLDAIDRRTMRRVRVYGGEIVVPPGQSIIVSAPLGGVLQAPPDGAPRVGQDVKKGAVVFQFLPLLTPESRANLSAAKVDAAGQVKSARTQLNATAVALERAKRVFADEAGSQRMVDEAQAQYDLAEKALEAAIARDETLARIAGELERGTAAPIEIPAPESGLLRTVSALPGQNVPAGAPLFEVLNAGRMWVRTPVYVGDLDEIDAAADATVGDLTARPGAGGVAARPAIAPPSGNALAGTVDVFHEVDNREGRFRPGQRVGVAMSLRTEAESLTAPWSAIVHDIHGGAWLYEQVGERQFARRRVEVRYVSDDRAVLAAGPAAGTKVVSSGAAELFGAETGFTK